MDTVSTTAITLKPRTFAKICQLVLERWGISLNSGKETLVRSRIAKRMRMLELRDVEDYLVYVLEDRTGVELQRLVDAISTNTTSFYREPDHFNFIRGAVDQWARDGARLLRIWSTAASTGEEPYTLAIELSETLESRPVEVRILATDINTEVLRTAQRGVYPGQTVQPVPKELRTRYFTRQGPEDDSRQTGEGRPGGDEAGEERSGQAAGPEASPQGESDSAAAGGAPGAEPSAADLRPEVAGGEPRPEPGPDDGQGRGENPSGQTDVAAGPEGEVRGSVPGTEDPSPEERELRQAMEAQLRRVPDDPAGLLRQRFILQHLRREGRLP